MVNLEPKVGPDLNKKLISMMFFILGFHCQMENNKAAPSAPPLWVFVVFHVAVETQNKKLHGNHFFIKVRPNFWPQIDHRLWVVLALNKKHSLGCFFKLSSPLPGCYKSFLESRPMLCNSCRFRENPPTHRSADRDLAIAHYLQWDLAPP